MPANTSRAFGTAVLELDDVGRQLKANLTIGGLSGTLSAAHIHGPALTGVNAPIIFHVAATRDGHDPDAHPGVLRGSMSIAVTSGF